MFVEHMSPFIQLNVVKFYNESEMEASFLDVISHPFRVHTGKFHRVLSCEKRKCREASQLTRLV